MGSHFVFLQLLRGDVNSTWLITSELANQSVRKALFTCVVYINQEYTFVSSTFKKLIQNLLISLQNILAIAKCLHAKLLVNGGKRD